MSQMDSPAAPLGADEMELDHNDGRAQNLTEVERNGFHSNRDVSGDRNGDVTDPVGNIPDRAVNGDTATADPSPINRKRKNDEGSSKDDACESSKKVKLADGHQNLARLLVGSDKSLLPSAIWHHIFTFCPPKSLGNLLRVNKLFKQYLDPPPSVPREVPFSVASSALSPLKPLAIWQASRRRFWPNMPAPLRSKSEIDMWRLVCSSRCQNCDKNDDRKGPAQRDSDHPGPGADGVAIIWPFAIRVCARCLLTLSLKDVDIMCLPSIPTVITRGLPFIYLTRDLDVLRTSASDQERLSKGQEMPKLYLRSDVEVMAEEFKAVKDMGSGTVDEWLKGLYGRLKDAQNDAAKWEKWDDAGGTIQVIQQLYPGFQSTQAAVLPSVSATPTQSAPASTIAARPALPSIPPHSFTLIRQERTAGEAAELKAARKAEIERRALLLDPPLAVADLNPLPSYQAAIQIVTPLDDSAWEHLKPRLLAQHAELLEKTNQPEPTVTDTSAFEHRIEDTLASTKGARELIDKDWEVAQAPLRVKIVQYANEVVHDIWDRGKRVTRDNCSRFAVDSLNYIRRRFYADVAKDAAAKRAAGQKPITDPPQGPFTQKLTLENMKWIFDNKIKPITENYHKDIFYCNGCEGNARAYGFEGVIQHYAAKHTTALSLGSIIVHWRAEWPEYPPFCAEVRPVTQSFQGQPPPVPFAGASAPPPAGYNHSFAPAAPPPAYPPNPSFGQPSYGEPHFHHPVPHPIPPPPFQHPTHFPAFQPAPYGQQPPYATPAAPPAPSYQAYQSPVGPYPPASVEAPPVYGPPQGREPTQGYGLYLPAHPLANPPVPQPPIGFPVPIPAAYPVNYQVKMDEVARHSREIWHALNSVKDLPGSARVITTVHHVAKRYGSKFHESLTLAMFIDGLSNNKEMRPVRNVNQLVCKACHLGLGNAAEVERDRESYSLPQLANHFQNKHVKPMELSGTVPLDWVTDMVHFVEHASLSSIRSFGGQYQKSLLAEVFPQEVSTRPDAPIPRVPTAAPQDTNQAGHVPREQHPAPRAAGEYRLTQSHELTQVSGPGRDNVADGMSVPRPPVESHAGQGSSLASHPPRSGRNDQQGRRSRNGRYKRGDRHDVVAVDGTRAARSPSNEKSQRDEEDARRQEEEIKAMWATERAETLRRLTEHVENRSSTSKPADAHEETDLMAALERQLETRHPRSNGNARTPGGPSQTNSQRASLVGEPHGDPRARYGSGRDDAVRAGQNTPLSRESPPRRQSYLGKRRRVDTHHDYDFGYDNGFVDNVRPPHPAESHGYRPEPPTEQYHYREGSHPRPRQAVEAYEIVHVIDERGEYYIRRPVRRETGPTYIHEQEPPHPGDGYMVHDPRHMASREPVAVGPPRETHPRSRRGGRRDGLPPYYDEYDPRYPAA